VNPAAFARLLADHERAGLYHLTPGGIGALAEACAQADLQLIVADFAETPRMADAMAILTKATACPAHEAMSFWSRMPTTSSPATRRAYKNCSTLFRQPAIIGRSRKSPSGRFWAYVATASPCCR
jgi:hypothetical protein